MGNPSDIFSLRRFRIFLQGTTTALDHDLFLELASRDPSLLNSRCPVLQILKFYTLITGDEGK